MAELLIWYLETIKARMWDLTQTKSKHDRMVANLEDNQFRVNNI